MPDSAAVPRGAPSPTASLVPFFDSFPHPVCVAVAYTDESMVEAWSLATAAVGDRELLDRFWEMVGWVVE